MDEKKQGKEAAKAMEDFCNSIRPDQKTFIEIMAKSHRTIQQTFTKLCVAWLKQLALNAEDGNYDDRNRPLVCWQKKYLNGYRKINFGCQ